MSLAIPSTLFGGELALLKSIGELAAPRLASASETSRETLTPMMDMLSARGDWHKHHLVSHSTSVLSFRMCNCDQCHSDYRGTLSLVGKVAHSPGNRGFTH